MSNIDNLEEAQVVPDIIGNKDSKIIIDETGLFRGVESINSEPKNISNTKEVKVPQLKTGVKRKRPLWEDEYTMNFQEWQKKDEELQTDPARSAKRQEWQGIFESTFKEMSSQRINRLSLRNRENVSGYLSVTTENVDDETLRANAAIVPSIFACQSTYVPDLKERSVIQAGLAAQEKKRLEDFEASWSAKDIEKFKIRLSLVGKNFANIAMFFPERTVADCVMCYYLIIKKNNPDYKIFMPKPMSKKKYRPPPMPSSTALAVYQQNEDSDCTTCGLVWDVRCSKCQQSMEPRVSARITRALADSLGNDDQKIANLQICPNCYEEEVNKRNAPRNAKLYKKPGKVLTSRWKQLNDKQKAVVRHEFARDVTFACTSCNKRVVERVDQLLAEDCVSDYTSRFKLQICKFKFGTSGNLSKIISDNVDNFLHEIWHSQQVRDYKVPDRSRIVVSLPYADVLSDRDVDGLFEHCLNFVRLYEPECGTLPAIDLVSTILYPEVIIRSVMLEMLISRDDAVSYIKSKGEKNADAMELDASKSVHTDTNEEMMS